MNRRYSEEQIRKYLAENAQGVPVRESCARYGFSDASFYGWRARYGMPGGVTDSLANPERRRLRQLEEENDRLRNLLADALLRLELLRHRSARRRTGSNHDEADEHDESGD